MPSESIVEVLIRRDGLTKEEAEASLEEGKTEFYARLDAGEMPFDLADEFWGLEPDYLEELY